MADGSTDRNAELRTAQKAVLDPQTETDEQRDFGATRGPSRVGQAETQAGSKSAALPASVGGRWAYAAPLASGFPAIHVVVGRGKILLVAGSGNRSARLAAGTFDSYVCSSKLTRCKKVKTPVDLFCAGHVLLPDGRALVGGGTTSYRPFKGAKFLYAFNFNTERYERLTPMEVGRWYPSMVTTVDGSTLITGGVDQNGKVTGTSEIFDHRTNTHHMLPGDQKFPLYPRIQYTKRLNYFFSGVGYGATGNTPPGFWDPFNDTFSPVKGLRTPKQRSSAASCFVGDLRNQDLLVMGGGSPAVNTTDKIKLSAATPKFVPGPTLKAKKQYLSCLTLPDGTLLEAGGGSSNKVESASYKVSLLTSINSSWKSLNPIPAGNHRLYHSSHFLLDDGRIVSLGSEPQGKPRSESVLVYSPPYLYKGQRPTIVSAPRVIKRFSKISVKTTGAATRLTFTRAPSPTHGMDVSDGYLSFPIKNGKVDMVGGWARYMPTGYYRMWAVNAKGAVSKAKWVYMCDPSTEGTECHCC